MGQPGEEMRLRSVHRERGLHGTLLQSAVREVRVRDGVDWAANEKFEISKFKFKFPRARTYELIRARSRLYRSQILQVNTRWKALAEIYTMHSFAPFSNRKIFVQNC